MGGKFLSYSFCKTLFQGSNLVCHYSERSSYFSRVWLTPMSPLSNLPIDRFKRVLCFCFGQKLGGRESAKAKCTQLCSLFIQEGNPRSNWRDRKVQWTRKQWEGKKGGYKTTFHDREKAGQGECYHYYYH